MKTSARARLHPDRGGDPLDGLVNLFDLGIVLSVAFLIAALSSIDLSPESLKERREAAQAREQPADAVVANPEEEVRTIELKPGQRVVGRGERLGTVYKLADGRTVIVRPPSP